MIKVVHSGKYIDYIFNFPASDTTLTWSFNAEGDGELFLNPLTSGQTTNIASYTIAGEAPTYPKLLTNSNSYSIAIVKTTAGAAASITLRQRRATNKTITFAPLDLSDLTVTSNYMLLTNVGTNGQVIITQNANIDPTNYVGAGVWTNSIIRGTVNLPDIATPYGGTGSSVFSWTFCVHCKLSGIDYVAVIGHATANNLNRGRAVCLINPTTLAVTNLDFVANSYTYINTAIGTGFDSNVQQQPQLYCENFISNKILSTFNSYIMEIDLVNRTMRTEFPFTAVDVGISTTKKDGYYNPIDNAYSGAYGQFNRLRGSTYSSKQNVGCYDYLRNAKLGTATYWGRISGYSFSGLDIFKLDNAFSSQVATIMKPKKDAIFLANNSYAGFILQNSPYTMNVTLMTDKTWASVQDASYANADGNKYIIITNTSRIVIVWINRGAGTIQQAYYDLPAAPLTICNDKPLISA